MSEKGYFTRDTMEFLCELRAHNDRDWFQAKRERFEEQARERDPEDGPPFRCPIGLCVAHARNAL
jgi:hypothetical protein